MSAASPMSWSFRKPADPFALFLADALRASRIGHPCKGGTVSRRATNKRIIQILSGALCVTIGVTGCSTTSAGSGATSSGRAFAPSMSAACAAGTKEGAVNYWSASDPAVFAKEIAPFEAEHPGIKVNFTSTVPIDVTQKVITETQAHHSLDVDATSTDLASAQPLFDEKLLMNVDWSALGVPKNLLWTYDGVGTYRTMRDFLGIGYNPKVVAKADLPTTWDQLINPKYSGRVIVDPRGIYLSGLAIAWGEPKTMTWLNNLVKTTKPQVVKGSTSSIQKVVSGEALFTTSAAAAAIAAEKQTGAPIDMAYLDVVTSQDKYGVLLAKAQHPNAAACFLGWFGSSEGQAQQLKFEYKSNTDQPTSAASGAKLSLSTTPADQVVLGKASSEISKALSN
jgi:iron(III) transport system substrate-binding protein